ncbi:MAG: CocE/NonD family hydrolase [Proteobacteria bacterium]|nr:CocE/NonD family hydrolase [Pseudomonadota bacterium]
MKPLRSHRLFVLLWLCALPLWAAAAGDYGFAPPRSADDPAAAAVMRDLAQRLIPVYQEADNDLYLANMTAMQVVSGAYGAAYDSSQTMRARHQGKPMDSSFDRAVIDAIYAHARALEANDHVPFAQAYTRSFQDVVQPLDDQRAADIMDRLAAPVASYRQPVQQAFDRWRTKGSIPEADAVALVRTWLAYESRRSYAVLIPQLAAAEDERRYSIETDVVIPLRGRTVIHATIVRSTNAQGPLPVLLRYTLDPRDDDAKRSAMRGYVGITAYARGRTPDGKGAVWPFVHDGDDAKAVIEWIARQAWCDGRVAMLGDGYSGYVAWAAARKQPAALKAIATIAPMAPGIDFPMAGQIYRNAMARWAEEYAQGGPPPADLNDAAHWRARDEAWYRKGQRYRDMDRIYLGQRSRLLRTWLTHPSHDRYWQKFLPSARQFAQIDIPVLTIAGYYGGADAGALYYHQQHLRQRPQADDTLVVGPYDASSIRDGTAANLRGLAIDAVAQVDLRDLCLRWFDHLFKKAPKPALLQDRVVYEVPGANEWRHVPALDAPQRERLRLYLDTRPTEGPHRLIAAPAEGDAGQVEVAVNLADRRDVGQPWTDALRLTQLPTRNGISFVGEPLAKDTEIAGVLRGVFDITPSRQDVDLSVALYAQLPGGGYQLLFDPYDFRASYARDRVHRRLLRAGERQLLPFTTERITAAKLPAGSRIVLVLAINKRLDRQINAGSGKAVNAETIADAKVPMRVRWHGGSYVEVSSGKP